jgi:hypothetical protein
MDGSISIGYVFLVAFLAFLGTFLATLLVNLIRDRRSASQQRKNFSIFVRLELEAAKDILEKLKTTYSNQKYFEYRLLDVLDKKIKTLEDSRKDSVVIGNVEIQEQYLSLITDLSLFASDLRGIEAFKDKNKNELGDKTDKASTDKLKDSMDWVKDKSTEKLSEFVDLKRQIEEQTKVLVS